MIYKLDIIEKIKDVKSLKQLLEKGYTLKGPRETAAQNLKAIEMFFRRSRQFLSENWLIQKGYKLVEPSNFTKGLKFAFKLIEGYPDKYFKTNYSLIKGGKEIALYLKYKDKHL